MLSLMALCCAGALSAQTSGQVATYTANNADGGISDALYNYAMGSVSDKIAKTDYRDETIEGSPYMSNTFNPGQLFYGDEPAGNIFFRYNAYNEEIETKQNNLENELIRGLSKDKKIRLVAYGKSMSFKTFIDKNGNTKNGYLTSIVNGDYKLYKHLKVTFKEAKKADNTFVQSTPAKFTQFTEYFLESPDGKRIDQVEMGNKKVLQLLTASDAQRLKEYLKDKKLKIKDEYDLIEVVNFLNNSNLGS